LDMIYVYSVNVNITRKVFYIEKVLNQ